MSVLIGHASKNENGEARGGKRGDQTGKEVYSCDWYNGGWHTVLRPLSGDLAEKSAAACEYACANDYIGYNQTERNTLYNLARENGFNLGSIRSACSCDCSSLVHVCAMAGGANLSYGTNAFVTSTMVNRLIASGDYKKLSGDGFTDSPMLLKRGDILVSNGHTAMVLGNGSGFSHSGSGGSFDIEEQESGSGTDTDFVMVAAVILLVLVVVLIGGGLLFIGS